MASMSISKAMCVDLCVSLIGDQQKEGNEDDEVVQEREQEQEQMENMNEDEDEDEYTEKEEEEAEKESRSVFLLQCHLRVALICAFVFFLNSIRSLCVFALISVAFCTRVLLVDVCACDSFSAAVAAAYLAHGAQTERTDGADLCRHEWSRGLRAAAAGCRRRQECQH